MVALKLPRSTPMPLVAFPCGSPSTSSVRRSATAKLLQLRLTAEVVLPTPPFLIRNCDDASH